VLSTSAFAAAKFLPGLRKSDAIEVVAVASRDAVKAAEYAAAHAIPTSYGSYEELLADPSIEVVYNPLPNHLHVEWTRRAGESGKHVLCEKPMGVDAPSLESLRGLTSRVHIDEAFMVRRHPQWTEVRDVVRSGAIGTLTHAHIAFAYTNRDPDNIRNIAEAGVPHQRVHLFGTTGRVEMTIPFNQPQDDSTVYLTHDGGSLAGLDAESHVVPAADQYQLLGEWFSAKVRNEVPTSAGLDDALRNMRVLDALFRSESSGRFEAV
jgi:predicted dehydrogenase